MQGDESFWAQRRVLLTGHTGFKGAWLALWLKRLGAHVTGVGLAPTTPKSLFQGARLNGSLVSEVEIDVRDHEAVARVVADIDPELVFHLAAQPLVRTAYEHPVGTFATNVMGTVHILDALRGAPSARVAVVVTSDKCYAPAPAPHTHREEDPMGGEEPYSASKGAAELAVTAYRSAFLAEREIAVASARAGNVIGGGDWARDRLVPDLMRGALEGRPVPIRHPDAVRPWQHVLCPLHGYLQLARALWDDPDLAGGWNFGPNVGDDWPVRQVANRFAELWPAVTWKQVGDTGPREAAHLRLDSTRARTQLKWAPHWDLDRALRATVDWYRAAEGDKDQYKITLAQIAEYEAGI